MGTFDAEGTYTPRKVTERDVSFADSINETIVELKEGKLVTGTVVRITRDEVLVEIGYKTEGVILNRELSIYAFYPRSFNQVVVLAPPI